MGCIQSAPPPREADSIVGAKCIIEADPAIDEEAIKKLLAKMKKDEIVEKTAADAV